MISVIHAYHSYCQILSWWYSHVYISIYFTHTHTYTHTQIYIYIYIHIHTLMFVFLVDLTYLPHSKLTMVNSLPPICFFPAPARRPLDLFSARFSRLSRWSISLFSLTGNHGLGKIIPRWPWFRLMNYYELLQSTLWLNNIEHVEYMLSFWGSCWI